MAQYLAILRERIASLEHWLADFDIHLAEFSAAPDVDSLIRVQIYLDQIEWLGDKVARATATAKEQITADCRALLKSREESPA